jgi:hypothetical protein
VTDPAIPESQETLAIQREELKAGKRHVMVYKGGLGPQPPYGMEAVHIGRDDYHFNPKVHSASNIQDAVANDTIGKHLRLGNTTKREALASGEPMVAVVERTPQGHEVRAAVGTHRTALSQLAHFYRTKEDGNTVGIEHAREVIRKRLA